MSTRSVLTRASTVAAAPLLGVRAISTTAARWARTPSMGDINPSTSSVESFHQKQQSFREGLAQAQKERGARAFGAQIPSDSTSSQTAASGSPGTDAGVTAQVKDKEPERKSGPLSNLIYGTKEGRELDAQLAASFSQVLARGKYVHSIVFHEVKPEKVEEYVKLVGHWYPKMAQTPENKVHLVGSWRTEVGDCDTFGMLFQSSSSFLSILHTNPVLQSTFGSTKSTRATTNLAIPFPTIPSLATLIASCAVSSTARTFR
jgi:hypothetical protein